MLVAGVTLLALGEVASPPIVDARVARLLALREVTAMILLASVAVLFLAFREGAALVVITMVVIGAVRLIVMVIVVGLLAHARSPSKVCASHCGPPVKRLLTKLARGGAAPEEPDADLDRGHDDGHDDADIERERHVRPNETEGDEASSRGDQHRDDDE
ncbi:MAG: hypothetical protein ABR593_09595, partial [Candidatus Limnocylindria bacterium]